jgi:DNA helicase-2/ATP-dependent DNA helicase PcrA
MIDLLSDLNEPQRQAVTHVDGPLLVLAGAGSGKTRVITRRVAYLVRQGIAPWNVLAITFTNKAAGEMKQRVESLGTPRGVTVSTFHALCARLLREFAAEAALAPNYAIYDRDDQLKVVKAAMDKAEVPTDRLTPSAVHAAISNAKNELKSAALYAQSAGDFFSRKVAAVYEQYERILRASNALDFDDLLLRMAELMRDRPDIRQLLGRRYRYVLIDEYQDTNHAQYLLAHGIAMEHENICATGDPDQSIYAWRGADINNILDFEKDYPSATVVRLEENYRSTTPILATASRLIAHNRQRKEKGLWTRRQGGAGVRVVVCDDEHVEARQVAAGLAELHAAGTPYSDMAVFFRVNALSRLMERELLRAAIPYRVARGVEFYNRKEIKDTLAYLRLLVNEADDLACTRIVNVPARGIGAATVGRLADAAGAASISLLEACRRAPAMGVGAAAAKKAQAFAAMIDLLRTGIDRPVRDVMADVLKKSGLEAALSAKDEETSQAKANVDELISSAREFDLTTENGRLGDYLAQVSLVSDVDHFEGGGGAVSLMTLHAAKGLEFPAVFVVGWEDGLLPFRRGDDVPGRRADAASVEEERRLAFVGMTRAMNELTLTLARMRMVRGRTEPRVASPFLGEIGREHVTVEEVTDSRLSEWAPRPTGGGYYSAAQDRPAAQEDERTVIESMQDADGFPHEYEYLKAGCRVRHEKFGEGKVVAVKMRWPDTRADIFFDNYGPKTIVLRYTRLEVL